MDDWTVDDLVPTKVAQDLDDGRLPIGAVLVLETITDQGSGVRFYTSDMSTWHAIGLLRSTLARLEQVDLAAWDED